MSDSRFLYVEIYGCHFLCWISDALFREESQERDSMQERQCLHIIQNTQALGVKKGKSSKKHKRGINHRVKDYKARFGKKMPCRNGICHLPSAICFPHSKKDFIKNGIQMILWIYHIFCANYFKWGLCIWTKT